jgi:hypothetical protein
VTCQLPHHHPQICSSNPSHYIRPSILVVHLLVCSVEAKLTSISFEVWSSHRGPLPQPRHCHPHRSGLEFPTACLQCTHGKQNPDTHYPRFLRGLSLIFSQSSCRALMSGWPGGAIRAMRASLDSGAAIAATSRSAATAYKSNASVPGLPVGDRAKQACLPCGG